MKAEKLIQLSGTNLEHAADHNKRVTLHAIRVGKSLTKVELAEITGLTAPAITNITRRLLDDGLIVEAGRRRGGRGQPPVKLEINATACYAIGINIDRDHITIVLVDFPGRTVARANLEIDFALPDQVREFYTASVETMLTTAGIRRDRLVGIGVALPDDLGAVDLPGRPSTYDQWRTTDVTALFAAPLDLPVFVENDAAAAAMGEQQLGHGQSLSSFFYILVSRALGGGLVIDSSYFSGASGRSGELGFLLHRAAGEPDRQIQTFVSLSGLAAPLAAAGYSVADMLASDGSDAVLEDVLDRWIDEAAEWLLEPMVAISCLINPAATLIGGRLPGRYVDRLAARLNARLNDATNVPMVATARRALLSADAPAVGAAILPFSHFLLPKSDALWKTEAASMAAAAE